MKHPRMPLWRCVGGSWLVGCAIVGCAAAATPTPVAGDSAANAPGKGSSEALPAVVLDPVAAPEDLLAVARASNLSVALDTLIQWAGLPFEWRAEVEQAVPGILAAADLRAPVELAATLDPQATNAPRVFVALSLPLRSREAALSLASERGWPTDVLDEATHSVDLGKPCYISASLGSAPARLVCSPKKEALEALAPFMTRGLPTLNLPESAVYASVKVEPFRRRYAERALVVKSLAIPFLLREARLDNPTFDGALADAAHAVADELIGLFKTDLEEVTFELDLDQPSEQLRVGTHLVLQDSRTWFAASLLDLATRSAEPTDLFWSAPAGSHVSYGASTNSEKSRDLYATLARLAEGFLDHEGLGTKSRKFVSATESLHTARGPSTWIAKPDTGGDPSQFLPYQYYLGNIQGDSEGALVRWLDEALTLLADPKLQASLGTRLKSPKAALQLKRQAQAIAGLQATVVSVELGGIPSLNEGRPVSLALLFAREGAQSWVGVGQSPAKLAAGLTAWRQEPQKRPPELAVLQQKSAGGGYSPLGSLIEPALRALEEQHPGIREMARRAMPAGGNTPVTYRVVVTSEGPRASLYASVPKSAVTDLAQAALAAFAGQ